MTTPTISIIRASESRILSGDRCSIESRETVGLRRLECLADSRRKYIIAPTAPGDWEAIGRAR